VVPNLKKVSEQQTPADWAQKGSKWRSKLKCFDIQFLHDCYRFFVSLFLDHKGAHINWNHSCDSTLGSNMFHYNIVPPNGPEPPVPRRRLMTCESHEPERRWPVSGCPCRLEWYWLSLQLRAALFVPDGLRLLSAITRSPFGWGNNNRHSCDESMKSICVSSLKRPKCQIVKK